MSLTAYNRLGAAVSTAMEASSQKTSDHMGFREFQNNQGWAASSQKTQADAETLAKARKSEYYFFDVQRTSDHQAMLTDMLENVIGEVTAEVAKLVTDDAAFDAQFEADNKARLAEWAEIAASIGVVGDIDIQ